MIDPPETTWLFDEPGWVLDLPATRTGAGGETLYAATSGSSVRWMPLGELNNCRHLLTVAELISLEARSQP